MNRLATVAALVCLCLEALPGSAAEGSLRLLGTEVRFRCVFIYDLAAPPVERIAECRTPYRVELRRDGCSNSFLFVDELVISNLRMIGGSFVPGAQTGSIVLGGVDSRHTRNSDGSCSLDDVGDLAGTYSGQFYGGGGSLSATFVGRDGARTVAEGELRPLAPPAGGGVVLPPSADVTGVRLSTDGMSASASVRLKFAPGVPGTNTNVYAFMLAPRERVQGELPAGQSSCVMAQLDPATSRLVSVSGENLRAYYTGVAAAQGQAVNILANIPIATVAGASLFVGYGPDSSAMISGGLLQHVVIVPGEPPCPDQVPYSPGALSGLWWNPAEPGWGIHLTQRRNVIFAAWYTYDGSGVGRWLVASSCTLTRGAEPDTGACSAPLYEVEARGNPDPRFPFPLNVAEAGSIQLDFSGRSSASMTYFARGQTRSIPLARQVFSVASSPPVADFTDLWWSRRGGWGLAISHQHPIMFLVWFVHDAQWKPVWYAASECRMNLAGDECTGTLFRTNAAPFGGVFEPASVRVTTLGPIRVRFLGPNHGVILHDGLSLGITRQIF